MTEHTPQTASRSLRLYSSGIRTGNGLPLPGILGSTTRAGNAVVDPLLDGLVAEKIYALGATTRGSSQETATLDAVAPELLAIEAEDGSTLFIRSDTLTEHIARLQPEAIIDGEVDFSRFHDPNARARGIGDVLWRAATVLRLPQDALLDEARQLALDWAKEQFGERVEAKAYEWGSALGAKALMWKIESRLAGRPGLYRWHDRLLAAGDLCPPGDPRLADAAQGKPMLVLIHGTASYTVGAYADLRDDEPTWRALNENFPGGIFGFEHRTFSESPAENALALLDALPKGAHVSLLTHSRGGLVGDLLCLGQVPNRVIDAYHIDLAGADDVQGLERTAAAERLRLRTIRDRLTAGAITVERYVRVACPARGTRFLSENLDAALSDFLGLLQWGGGALVGAAASALGGPVAGEAFGKGASSCLGVVKRLALEIAGRRIDARLIPGIAAMCIDSPLAAFLAHPDTDRRAGIAMAIIAGDTEFDGLGMSNMRRRIANLFCDWRLFERNDNDLVVDTDSMYAGLGFRPGAKYLYDQDASVTHFRYFRNPLTRGALKSWLTQADDLSEAADQTGLFEPLTSAARTPWHERDTRQAARTERSAISAERPVVIIIPGIMGSHLGVDRQRIWFDLPNLCLGKLAKIGDPAAKNVVAEDLFEMFYGDLAEYLAATHHVVRCPYDWRLSLESGALALKERIEQALREHPGQPVRLLAHSMGGLVARTLISQHAAVWKSVVDSGGRLLMLGTPNNGAHLMVNTLLGKSDSMRMLEKIDLEHNLQQLLDIIAGFPGALALLPRPGFHDTGDELRVQTDTFYDSASWQTLKEKSTDRWYGNGVAGVPPQTLLTERQNFWKTSLPDNTIAAPERVMYIFGQSDKTPCGLQRAADGRLKLLFTADGDGSVTWASGRLDNLDPDTRCWYMPVEHGDLADTQEFFPAIDELLDKGNTSQLGRLPRRRGAASSPANFVLEAPPPILASEDELARAFMGSGPRRRQTSRRKSSLRVAVRGGDLRFLDQPVLCGHYIGDAISGAEASLDEMLEGVLAERERLGVYAAEIGSAAIILRPPSAEEGARGTRLGAVIVGLGKFNGQLSARQITESVRAGVVRFLLQLRDALQVPPEAEVQLYSLLIGWNSTASLSIAESVAAITRGVLEANHQFSDALSLSRQRGATVTELCFIELFRHAAISAAHAVLDLPQKLEGELKRLGASIEPASALSIGDGMMDRLSADGDLGHWSRLIVTDADRDESTPNVSLMGNAALPKSQDAHGDSSYVPGRLKYIFLSQRARAEAVVQQRQPGLIETIIRDQRRNPAYDAKLGQTLFQLMVPLDYKAVMREQSRLLLVLDSYAANLPWELLQNEGEPLVLRMPLVRQLTTPTFRHTVRTANTNSACIIVAPSTYGFDKRFGGNHAQLDELPAAIREGQAVCDSLRNAGWSDNDIVLSPPDREALDIFSTLYERPYRVVMIAAHGIFEARGLDGRDYTGIVLSDGLLLTAVEADLMEVVPEVVFISCCHLGSVNNPHSQPNKLAYSLSRKLIEMGVRCVVAAGWAVNDEAACTFASTFFDQLTAGETFGEAIFKARQTTYARHPGSNTWGAYQAYGDPGYRLQTNESPERGQAAHPHVAVDELLSALCYERNKAKRRGAAVQTTFAKQRQWVQRQLARCPADWAERPDVLQAIAELYGDLGHAGFDAAREAYQFAVQREDKAGRVAVSAIEQLANMEARHGGKLAEQEQFAEAMPLIDSAIRRLNALAESVRGDDPGLTHPNAERAAMLGSAYKLKAAALMRKGRKWASISPWLQRAAAAYLSGVDGDPGRFPYNTLNALPLAWLLESAAGSESESESKSDWARAQQNARQCALTARQKFATSKDFWDAVMSVDGELCAWLLGGTLGDGHAPRAIVDVLQERYEQAVQSLPRSPRQWDSVIKQWRLLAGFIKVSQRKEGEAAIETLLALADRFETPTAVLAGKKGEHDGQALHHPERRHTQLNRPRSAR